MPRWWNGLHSGLRSRPRKGCEFKSRPGHQIKGKQAMLVSELIQELQKLDPKLQVIRAVYDGGVAEAEVVMLTTIALNANPETNWWQGPHEVIDDNYVADNSYRDLTQCKRVDAVFIG